MQQVAIQKKQSQNNSFGQQDSQFQKQLTTQDSQTQQDNDSKYESLKLSFETKKRNSKFKKRNSNARRISPVILQSLQNMKIQTISGDKTIQKKRSVLKKTSKISAQNSKKNILAKIQNIEIEKNYFNKTQQSFKKRVIINSQKNLKHFAQIDSQSQGKNFNQKQFYNNIASEFTFQSDFITLKNVFSNHVILNKYSIGQNTVDFITIKSKGGNYCQCWIKSCFSLSDLDVYQIKTSSTKKNKAKFILISGNQQKFQNFCKISLINLWENKIINLKPLQTIKFFFQSQRQNLKSLKQRYQALQKIFFSKQTDQGTYKNSKSIIKNFGNKLKRISQKGLSLSSLNNNLSSKQLNEDIHIKYKYLRSRLLQIQDKLIFNLCEQQIDKELQYQIYINYIPIWKIYIINSLMIEQQYISKKQIITKEYSLRSIFLFLQISQQYQYFLKKIKRNSETRQEKKSNFAPQLQTDSHNNNQISLNSVPYQQCINILQKIQSSCRTPVRVCFNLRLFYQKLNSLYYQYCQNKIRLSGMDDQLPMTIFCVLMADINKDFIGIIKWIKDYLEVQENRQIEKKIVVMIDAAITFITDIDLSSEDHNVKQGLFKQSNKNS